MIITLNHDEGLASLKCGRSKVFLNVFLLKGPKSVQLRTTYRINAKTNEYRFTVNLEKTFLQIIVKDHRNILKFIVPSNLPRQMKTDRFIVVYFRIDCLLYHQAPVIVTYL